MGNRGGKKKRQRAEPFLATEISLLRHTRFTSLSHATRIIYLNIAAEASLQNKGGRAAPGMTARMSYRELSRYTNASTSTIAKAITSLMEAGFIEHKECKRTLAEGPFQEVCEFTLSDQWRQHAK